MRLIQGLEENAVIFAKQFRDCLPTGERLNGLFMSSTVFISPYLPLASNKINLQPLHLVGKLAGSLDRLACRTNLDD